MRATLSNVPKDKLGDFFELGTTYLASKTKLRYIAGVMYFGIGILLGIGCVPLPDPALSLTQAMQLMLGFLLIPIGIGFLYYKIKYPLKRQIYSIYPPLNPGGRFCFYHQWNLSQTEIQHEVKFKYRDEEQRKYLCKEVIEIKYSCYACNICGKEKVILPPAPAYLKTEHGGGFFDESFFCWPAITLISNSRTKYLEYQKELKSKLEEVEKGRKLRTMQERPQQDQGLIRTAPLEAGKIYTIELGSKN